MSSVHIEHESKFAVPDCLPFASRLKSLGRRQTPWHFEANVVYDQAGSLAGSHRMLRLRRGMRSVLTFKEPAPETAQGVKSRQETECRIADPTNMDHILRALGYLPVLRYEKFRTIWELGRDEICLDILPFGHFLEIEAHAASIPVLAEKIGLDPVTAQSATYHDLHQLWLQKNSLPPQVDFVFSEAEKERLARLLHCNLDM